ncbi:MAG TPA: hypothetical protein VM076_21025 [Gemmatimonadaceae bacterium]|nr:hypothetical protein [Gemmatimonadaceae bacterium]
MSFTLTMSGVIVGRSELETRDPATQLARGAFRPGLGYDLVQPVFALYETAAGNEAGLAKYRKAREALRLQLADSSGAPLTVEELHVRQAADHESSESGLVLEVQTSDPIIWPTRR